MKKLEKGVCAEIKNAEKTVALTEEKCTATTKRISEMMELEKTERNWVTDIVHILRLKDKNVAFDSLQK